DSGLPSRPGSRRSRRCLRRLGLPWRGPFALWLSRRDGKVKVPLSPCGFRLTNRKRLGDGDMIKLTAPLLIATVALAGCGRLGDSSWNPLSWGSAPTRTLEPEGGYAQVPDARPDVPQITAARWEPLNEGRLLVVN